jgi:hypothetical protein
MMHTHNLIHRSDLLQRDAGTFYSAHYGDAERVFTLFDSYCWLGQTVLEEALDAAKLFYRHQIPPLHRELFFPITVREQELLAGAARWLHYGDAGLKYGQDWRYGMPARDRAGVVPLPKELQDIDLCTDVPVEPSVILLKNIDFEIQKGALLFYRNLFDLFPSEGEAPYRECTFWLRSAYFDRRYIQDRLGVLTRTHGPSTKNYLDFCNLVINSVMEGTSAICLTRMICKLFDVPCTEEMETVEVVDGHCLVTDKRVYFAAKESHFRYTKGDVLPPGTILTDAVTAVYRKQLPKGQPLFLERRFLGREYLSGLYFPNEQTRVSYSKNTSKITFPMVGRQEDIARFWHTLHEREAGDQLLSAATGGWINPAEFVYENVLYPRVRLFYIDFAKTGLQRLPMVNTQILRSLLPPGMLFSLQLAMPPMREPEMGVAMQMMTGKQGVGMKPVDASVAISAGEIALRAC